MSCQLFLFSAFHDILEVRDYLFPALKDVTVPQSESSQKKNAKDGDGWDMEWDNWNEDQSQQMEEEEDQSDSSQSEATNDQRHKWLQDCVLSVSPAGDLIAMAHQQRMVLLAPRYDPEKKGAENDMQYCVVWQGGVVQDNIEAVTALLCLPLASQKRSTQGAPDWTCVLVGFSSGFVRMYTESGTLLLSQKLHTEPVQKLKCNTYTPPRYLGVPEQHEEVVILYQKALVTIDGFSLFQALKACRNQVARATASGEASLQPPPLAYKKWAPQEQDTIHDCHTTGVNTPNPFDQMMAASMHSYTASIRPTPPAASVYLLSGVGPYVGFFSAVEGSAQPILSEVAYAVASKLKSAFMSAASGWLSFGGRSKMEEERQPKIEPATPLPLRFGLPDHRREGLSISLSPNNMYAATTDSFGRVMLLDVNNGVAVRMWKGYRDAQVGWIEVREEEDGHGRRSHKQGRIAQFLVIYAARRGILEVWMVGNGPRVAAFNVSKHCQLIDMSYGIMGLNNVTCKGVKCQAFQCALMDVDGSVKTIEVPFHLALSDKNNKRVRDMHLLKKLKLALKDNTTESDGLEKQVKDLLLNIRISNIAQQGLERVLGTRYLSPRFQESVLQACINRLKSLGEEHLDIDRRLFLQYCKLQEQLIVSYTDLRGLGREEGPGETSTEMLQKLLGLDESEVEHFVCQLNRCDEVTCQEKAAAGSHVRFQTDNVSHIFNFLNCFSCQPHLTEPSDTASQPGTNAISLVKDLSDDRRLQLGLFMFDNCFKSMTSVSDLGAILRKSQIPTEEIGGLLTWTWLSEDHRPLNTLPAFYNLLKIITCNIDTGNGSTWWQTIRDLCSNSTHCQSAFLAAMAARAVAMETIGSATRTKDNETTPGSPVKAKDPDADTVSCHSDRTSADSATVWDWDSVAAEREAWNRLVKQLEDLVALGCMLQLSPETSRRHAQSEPVTVSVSRLLDGGRGCITEVVARHVARVGFQPEDLYQPIVDEQVLESQEPADQEQKQDKTNKDIVRDQMHHLRHRFPHSLENDVLFANCCWEYTVQWNKDPEEVGDLNSALEFLKLVQNAILRQGVASMMWHMFMLKRFQATAQLMEKVGKTPKERLCRKEIGVSENSLPRFISLFRDFFTIIMEANCEVNEVPVFNLESLWTEVKGTVSLVELAIDQKSTNYGLLNLHHLLVTLMHAILVFSMKSVRVISLFDSKGRSSFFEELHSHPLLPGQNSDTSVAIYRKQFLTRVITQAVLSMKATLADEDAVSSGTFLSRVKSSSAAKWPVTVVEMAQEFGLDVDYFKRHHVCELYSAGFDKFAEEVLLTVNDHESLGTQLLVITGQRVAQYLNSCQKPALAEMMSKVNPALSTWLKAMNPKLLVSPDRPVSDLTSLISHTVNQLPEGHREYELAISLVELVQSLQTGNS